ncbi:ABC-type Fe3+-hydroxamate transport system substrate-binding protein [Paenibacillus sp. DS2015]
MSKISLYDEHVDVSSLDDLLFKIRSIEYLRDAQMEQQLINMHVLIIVKNGLGRLTVDLQEYQLKQDTIHIARPGQTIGVSLEDGNGLDLYVIKFGVFRYAEPMDTCPLKGEIKIYPQTQPIILCDLMYTYCRSEQSLERFRGQFVFQELLYWIMTNIRHLPELDSRTALERTKTYIECHYKENLTIEQLARMAKVSPKYYVDLFKKTYGKSTIDYVTEVRVNCAKQIMVQSDARLQDIAHQVGYNDEFYFSRKFKQEVGVSPKAYMKKRRRKIVAYSTPILGQLLALKMIPYAAPLHPKWSAYYYKMYRRDIPLHLSGYRFNEDWETNIESITDAGPDMIICLDNLDVHEQEKLKEIAPVSFIPWMDTNWREQLQLTAQLLEATQEADSWLYSYDRKVNATREHLSRELKGETILVMSIHKKCYYLCPTRGMRDVLYDDLQLNPPSGFDPAMYNQMITADQLVVFDADRILLNICQEPESLSHWEWFQSSSLWQDLKAVRKNHVYLISSDPWREYSAYACERILDDLLKLLD